MSECTVPAGPRQKNLEARRKKTERLKSYRPISQASNLARWYRAGNGRVSETVGRPFSFSVGDVMQVRVRALKVYTYMQSRYMQSR